MSSESSPSADVGELRAQVGAMYAAQWMAEGYTAPTSTEGVEQSRTGNDDDPMIGGGSR